MSSLVDLSGSRFGKLTVVSKVGVDGAGTSRWACVCDCGANRVATIAALRAKQVRSCKSLDCKRESRGPRPKWGKNGCSVAGCSSLKHHARGLCVGHYSLVYSAANPVESTMMDLIHSRLLEALHYEALTGVFTWRIRCGTKKAGTVAGNVNRRGPNKGYVVIGLDHHTYQAHRLAWFYMKSTWPLMEIDHFNTLKTDNRLDNLRDVTPLVNAQNKHAPRRDSTTGVQGVRPMKGKFQVRIQANGTPNHLGTFGDIEKARAVQQDAKRRLHPEAFR